MPQHAIEVDQQGMTIRGMVYRPDAPGRHPSVLLLHGFTGQRIESTFAFVQIARSLASRGIAAVTFDFRHSGESDGSFDQMLVSGELADAMRMTEWLQGQPFADRSRLGLLGFSLGGLLAGCAVARSSAFRALALMAPTTPQNLVGNVCKRPDNCPTGKPLPNEPLIVGPFKLHDRFVEDVLALDPLTDCVKNPRPTLLVQGTGDKAVPPEVSRMFVDRMRSANIDVDHRLLEDADHGFSTPAARTQLIAAVSTFFAAKLG